jgi:hypothetical protein
MKVKVNYDRSEIVEFQSDADKGHNYLRLIFVPEKMSLLERAAKGRSSEYQMNFYPQRDNEGAINQEFEDAIIDAFNNKEIDKEPVYVDRVSVEIAPVVMTYQTDSRRGNYSKGDIIMEGNNARIYTSIQLTCLMKIVKGEEVPIMSENELKARANAIRAYRIDEGQWYDAEEYLANANDETEEEEQPDIINDEPEQPKQQPQNRQPNRPVRR